MTSRSDTQLPKEKRLTDEQLLAAAVRLLEYVTFHDNRYGQMGTDEWQSAACNVGEADQREAEARALRRDQGVIDDEGRMKETLSADQIAEGWTWLSNSRKWHYFTRADGRSLCGKYLLFKVPDELETDNRPSVDNCAGCVKALRKRKAS